MFAFNGNILAMKVAFEVLADRCLVQIRTAWHLLGIEASAAVRSSDRLLVLRGHILLDEFHGLTGSPINF
jgi:hypothetical protein